MTEREGPLRIHPVGRQLKKHRRASEDMRQRTPFHGLSSEVQGVMGSRLPTGCCAGPKVLLRGFPAEAEDRHLTAAPREDRLDHRWRKERWVMGLEDPRM